MAPEPVALVPLAAANALPVASVVEVTATKGEASQPPLVDPPHPDSEDDDLDSDDDYDSEDEEQNHLINGALLGLEMLPPGAEVRQRIGTSKLGIKKTSWSKEEDKILTEIVTKNGAARWSHVASHLPGPRGKQCRERWFNHLCPEVKKGSWSAEEDRIIMESVARYGTRWSKIVKLMPGRTDNAIKNRYNSAMRKVKRLEKIKGDHEPTMTYAAGVIVAPGPANSACRPSPPPFRRVRCRCRSFRSSSRRWRRRASASATTPSSPLPLPPSPTCPPSLPSRRSRRRMRCSRRSRTLQSARMWRARRRSTRRAASRPRRQSRNSPARARLEKVARGAEGPTASPSQRAVIRTTATRSPPRSRARAAVRRRARARR